ncbi:hypothetical protein TNCV_2855751, partial [Trichonephila clavipes]
ELLELRAECHLSGFGNDFKIMIRENTLQHRLPQVTMPNEERYLAVTDKRNRRSIASKLPCQHSSAPGMAVSRHIIPYGSSLGQIGL